MTKSLEWITTRQAIRRKYVPVGEPQIFTGINRTSHFPEEEPSIKILHQACAYTMGEAFLNNTGESDVDIHAYAIQFYKKPLTS